MRQGRASKKRIIITAAAAVVLIAAFGLIMYLIEQHGLIDEQFGDTGGWGSKDEDDQVFLTLSDVDYISDDDIDAYLIAGTDGGGVDKGDIYKGELADFISILLIDNTTEKYAFYQISRDSMVDVPVMNENGDIQDFALEQLSTAHWYGKTPEERNENLANAVSDVVGGIDIDGYYVLNMADIGEVNDAIGGVDIDIDDDMTDLDPTFKKGATVHLTGKQAENYLRARMTVGNGTNAERMDRQRQYMQKAYNMTISQLRENPDYINDLYEELDNKVQSDGTGKRISAIANQVTQYQCVGIISFKGETRIGDAIDEGITHEEFYVDEKSVLSGLRKVMNIREDDTSDEEDEE